MVAIAQAGLLGFAPQVGMEGAASLWQYHKAMAIDLSAIDDQRVGPPEIGGRPLPTIPYKAGVTVAGGFTVNPRLEGSLGWLLYGALGYKNAATPGIVWEQFLSKTEVTSGSGNQTTAVPAGTQAAPSNGKICVRIWRGDNTGYAPTTVTVSGSDAGGSAQDEVFNFTAGPTTGSGQRAVGICQGVGGLGYESIVGGKTFSKVGQIVLPKRGSITDTIYVSIGWEDTVLKSHVFRLDPNDPGVVPWMAFRKFIPRAESTTLSYGEQYNDCKVLGSTFTLPNDGLISSRFDVMGRTFDMVDDPFNVSTGAWNLGLPSTEDYLSVPIGCNVAGYLKVPFFDNEDFPVVAANVSFANTPADPRTMRVFGSPFARDVAVIGRGFTFDMTVLWQNPDLYKSIYGNSRTATEWSAIPFTSRLDIQALSPSLATGSYGKYGLRVEAAKVMLAITGGIQLVGNQTLMMRVTGSALDVTGDYVLFTLDNLKTDGDYTWPT